MTSDEGEFWDKRYRAEGAIWGDAPSPTAGQLLLHVPRGARVLEVGFGYGRDLASLVRHGYQVCGIELSSEGFRRAAERLNREGLTAERLILGRFEDNDFAAGSFNAILCHRMIHLLVTSDAIQQFAAHAERLLTPGGVLCVGARNDHDLNPAGMVEVGPKVYEYVQRPGHRIRYWDDATFHDSFDAGFAISSLSAAVEPETIAKPTPCHLTVMVGLRKPVNGARAVGDPALQATAPSVTR